jgi:hypothetical protein
MTEEQQQQQEQQGEEQQAEEQQGDGDETSSKLEEVEQEAEEAKQEVKELEKDPPEKLEDWPEGKAKYETFGGAEGEHGYHEGPEQKLGPSALRHLEDGSVEVDGEKVDDPKEYKGEPIPGGPTDPDTPAARMDKASPADVSDVTKEAQEGKSEEGEESEGGSSEEGSEQS